MQDRADWRAFLIGGGTYSVPRAWHAGHVPVAVTVAELDPAVTEAARDWFWYEPGTDRILNADARQALASDPARYDVILGDAFGDIAVPQHLITREFFALVRDRLTPGGVYLMNVIDHMDRLQVLASVVATARTVWPSVEVWTDPNHDPAETRRVFILVAGETPSARTRITNASGDAIRIAADSVQAIVDGRDPVIFTDDYAPIDRLLGDRGEG